MIAILRRFTSALVLTAALSAPAIADEAAEAFVRQEASRALVILGDETLAIDDKQVAFRNFVDDVADVPRITRFVLGRYARRVNAQDYAAFEDAFREYAAGVYETRLSDYGGETLTVEGSTDRNERDSIVHTVISGGAQDEPLPVNWRVLTSDGEPRVVDVEVYGVWLALNQREEIVGIIGSAGGQVAAATRALEDRNAVRDTAS